MERRQIRSEVGLERANNVPLSRTAYAPEEYPIAYLAERVLRPAQRDLRCRRGERTKATLAVNATPIRDVASQVIIVISIFYAIAAQLFY